MQCLGVVEKSGDYEGKPYHNFYVSCNAITEIVPTRTTHVFGIPVETVKVSYDVISFCELDPADLPGADIEFVYDKYGRVKKVVLA
jgi:hypothetical protein